MDGMMWLDDEVVATPVPAPAPGSPQDQVEALKRELAEVRKELASKMVQLARRDQGDRVAADQAAEAKAAELAAAAKADGDRKLHEMSAVVQQLEAALSLRNEVCTAASAAAVNTLSLSRCDRMCYHLLHKWHLSSIHSSF